MFKGCDCILVVFYLSPGLGENFFGLMLLRMVELGCRFLGFTESLCFCAELSNKGFVSPTLNSASVFCFLKILCTV